jgi:hypothetical protein
VTGLAVIRDTSVVDTESRCETIGIMTGTTISIGYRVYRYSRAFAECIDTVVIVVTRFAGLHCWVDYVVIEDTTEIEGDDAMTGGAVDICNRMTGRWITGLVIRRDTMTGVTSLTDYIWASMVRVSVQETRCGVAVTTLRNGIGMCATFEHRKCFADGNGTVMTTRTFSGYVRVVKFAVCSAQKKTGRIMAVITFCRRRSVKF